MAGGGLEGINFMRIIGGRYETRHPTKHPPGRNKRHQSARSGKTSLLFSKISRETNLCRTPPGNPTVCAMRPHPSIRFGGIPRKGSRMNAHLDPAPPGNEKAVPLEREHGKAGELQGTLPPTVTPSSSPLAIVAQHAAALGVTPITIWRLTKRGLLKPNRATRCPLYPVAEIKRFLEA